MTNTIKRTRRYTMPGETDEGEKGRRDEKLIFTTGKGWGDPVCRGSLSRGGRGVTVTGGLVWKGGSLGS